MAGRLSSRDRMLAAINCQEPDYVPCSFMLFAALKKGCRDEFEFIERQLALGLDPYVEVPLRPTR